MSRGIISPFSPPDKSLIRLIRNREPKLTPKEIVESLRRLDLRFESATPVPSIATSLGQEPKPATSPRSKIVARARRQQKGKKHFGISLAKLIDEGYLSPPIRLFRKYKGRMMEATLFPDGAVEFQGQRYPSCSTAAETARSTVTGRKMNTNGWSFWQYQDGKGKKETLLDVRERYLKTEGKQS